METIKKHIAISGLICLTSLQIASWYFNKNGTITALCYTGIGGIIAYYFGKLKGSKTA